VLLAPFVLPGLRGKAGVLRRHAGILFVLSLTGVALFHSLVYLGLRSTTAVNAILLNSSIPLFILLCAWVLDRERATARQIAGMLVSLAGILLILSRGNPGALLELELHWGDVWVLLAMPIWGIYTVLFKRRPAELGGLEFLFVIAATGVLILAPGAALAALYAPPRWPSPAEATGVLYMGIAASLLAYICWNRGVAAVGANTAGFTVHLLPVFGTVLAILFLGETFAAFHAAGVAAILAGVLLATLRK
jgi:drug/metabolite transporter (DMT)-like permease